MPTTIIPVVVPIVQTDNTQVCEDLIRKTSDISTLTAPKLQKLADCINTLYPKMSVTEVICLKAIVALGLFTFIYTLLYMLYKFLIAGEDTLITESILLDSFIISISVTVVVAVIALIVFVLGYGAYWLFLV